MKRWFAFLLSAVSAVAQLPPPRATVQEVLDGRDNYKYVTPFTLSNYATLATNAISVTAIRASGTPNSTTFLRGDGQWVDIGTPGSEGTADFVASTDPLNIVVTTNGTVFYVNVGDAVVRTNREQTIYGNLEVHTNITTTNLIVRSTATLNALRFTTNTIRIGSDTIPATGTTGYFQGVFIGGNAGPSDGNANEAVVVGWMAGQHASNTIARSVIAGTVAGRYATNAAFSILVGYGAGSQGNLQESVAIGRFAGVETFYSPYSVLVGGFAGRNATNAPWATMLGYEAGAYAPGSTNMVAIGVTSGRHATNSGWSVFIGGGAGRNFENSPYNIVIGGIGSDATSRVDRLMIHSRDTTIPLLYGEFDNRLLRVHGWLDVTNKVRALEFHGSGAGLSNIVVAAVGRDDATNLVALGNGTWYSLSNIYARSPGVVNVRDFGAKGDGVTDDLPAIQAALRLLETQDENKIYKTLYFPAGVYAVSGPIRLRTYMKLKGDGPGLWDMINPDGSKKARFDYASVVKPLPTFSGDALVMWESADPGFPGDKFMHFAGIEGMGFVGHPSSSDATPIVNKAIVLPWAGETTIIRDVAIHNFLQAGIHIMGTPATANIENVSIHRIRGYSILVTRGHDGSSSGTINLIRLSSDAAGQAIIGANCNAYITVVTPKIEMIQGSLPYTVGTNIVHWTTRDIYGIAPVTTCAPILSWFGGHINAGTGMQNVNFLFHEVQSYQASHRLHVRVEGTRMWNGAATKWAVYSDEPTFRIAWTSYSPNDRLDLAYGPHERYGAEQSTQLILHQTDSDPQSPLDPWQYKLFARQDVDYGGVLKGIATGIETGYKYTNTFAFFHGNDVNLAGDLLRNQGPGLLPVTTWFLDSATGVRMLDAFALGSTSPTDIRGIRFLDGEAEGKIWLDYWNGLNGWNFGGLPARGFTSIEAATFKGYFEGNGAGLTNIPASGIAAGGTRDSTTFLRGDGQWAVPPGGGGSTTYVATENPNYITVATNGNLYTIGAGPRLAKTDVTNTWQAGQVLPYVKVNGSAEVTGVLQAGTFAGSASGVSNVPVAGIAASGTRDSTTFLRGDGVWATPPTGGGGLSGWTVTNIWDGLYAESQGVYVIYPRIEMSGAASGVPRTILYTVDLTNHAENVYSPVPGSGSFADGDILVMRILAQDVSEAPRPIRVRGPSVGGYRPIYENSGSTNILWQTYRRPAELTIVWRYRGAPEGYWVCESIAEYDQWRAPAPGMTPVSIGTNAMTWFPPAFAPGTETISLWAQAPNSGTTPAVSPGGATSVDTTTGIAAANSMTDQSGTRDIPNISFSYTATDVTGRVRYGGNLFTIASKYYRLYHVIAVDHPDNFNVWAGMVNNPGGQNDWPSGDCVVFVSTNSAWHVLVKVGGANTIYEIGEPVTAGKRYVLSFIRHANGDVGAYINGQLRAVVPSANLPDASQNLLASVWVRSKTTSSSVWRWYKSQFDYRLDN